MSKPRIFIGTARESLSVAHALQENLDREAEVTIWKNSAELDNEYFLDAFRAIAERSDYGIFVFTPDDTVTMRGKRTKVVRDNVLFELGLLIGRLGRKRTFVIVPRGSALHIPSDLLGVPPYEYDANRTDGNLSAALSPSCAKILAKIKTIESSRLESPDLGIQKAATFTDFDETFANLLQSKKKLTTFFIHSRRWRETRDSQIQNFLKGGGSLKVFLPDRRNISLMKMIKDGFDDGPQLDGFVSDAYRYFDALLKSHPKSVCIHAHGHYPTYSFYCFEDCAVFAMYPTTAERKPVPTFLARKGSAAWDFVTKDIQMLERLHKKPLNSSEIKKLSIP